jgi:hypothetical protein
MLFFYTPGGSEGLFLEGGISRSRASRCPHGAGTLPRPPADLFEKYGLEALPE